MNWQTLMGKRAERAERKTALAIINELKSLQDSTLKVQCLAVRNHIRQFIVRLMEKKGGEKDDSKMQK